MFDLKSLNFPVVSLILKTSDYRLLEAAFTQRFAATPDFFSHEPILIDLSPIRDQRAPLEVKALLALLRRYGMLPIAAKNGNELQMKALLAAGLAPCAEVSETFNPDKTHPSDPTATADINHSLPKAAATTTVVVEHLLRSGQQIYAKNADLVVLSTVSHGAEVIADGHIHVYAPLRGKAIAGAAGNKKARLFTTRLEAELISIAGVYHTGEQTLLTQHAGRATQIWLEEDKLILSPLSY